jgi:hypothetical protein
MKYSNSNLIIYLYQVNIEKIYTIIIIRTKITNKFHNLNFVVFFSNKIGRISSFPLSFYIFFLFFNYHQFDYYHI